VGRAAHPLTAFAYGLCAHKIAQLRLAGEGGGGRGKREGIVGRGERRKKLVEIS